MRRKNIEAHITRKFEDWLESIEDGEVRALAERNTIITGGCIASLLSGEKVNDYDLYFRNKETVLALAKYYVARFKTQLPVSVVVDEDTDPPRVKIRVKSAGIASETEEADDYQYLEGLDDAQEMEADRYVEKAMKAVDEEEDEDDSKSRYRPVFLSSNCVSLSQRIQCVIRFYGDPEQIHDTYDYVHCTNYWTSLDRKLVLNADALAAILTKELVYKGSKYPLCSIIRSRKFLRRGWIITAGQYLKMVMQLNALDLTDLGVLEDQLIGVDVAYFLEVINELRAKNPEKVDTAYLMTIIDKMF